MRSSTGRIAHKTNSSSSNLSDPTHVEMHDMFSITYLREEECYGKLGALKTAEDWEVFCDYLKRRTSQEAQNAKAMLSIKFYQDVLLIAIQSECEEKIIDSILKIKEIPISVNHVNSALEASKPFYLEKLLTPGNEELLYSAKISEWQHLNKFLKMKKIADVILTEVLAIALLNKNFDQVIVLINELQTKITDVKTILTVGTKVDVCDKNGDWLEAEIKEAKDNVVVVKFLEFSDKNNETINFKIAPHRFAEFQSRSKEGAIAAAQSRVYFNWQDAFKKLFLTASKPTHFEFINLRITEFIDANDTAYFENLVTSHLESGRWEILNCLIDKKVLQLNLLEKIRLMALKNMDLKQLMRLENTEAKLSKLDLKQSYSTSFSTLAVGNFVDTVDLNGKWSEFKIKAIVDDKLFGDWGWIDTKAYPQAVAATAINNYSRNQPQDKFNLVLHVENTLLKVSTQAEWDYVLDCLTDEAFKSSLIPKFFSDLFTRALITKANNKTLIELIKSDSTASSSFLLTENIVKGIELNNLEWIASIKENDSERLLTNAVFNFNKETNVIDALINFSPEQAKEKLAKHALKFAIILANWTLVKHLLSTHLHAKPIESYLTLSEIPEMAPTEDNDLGLQPGESCFANDKLGWYSAKIIGREGNNVFVKYDDFSEKWNQHIPLYSSRLNRTELYSLSRDPTVKDYAHRIRELFFKANSESDWECVIATLEKSYKALGFIPRLLAELIIVALASEVSPEGMQRLLVLAPDFKISSDHIALCFKSQSTAKLAFLLSDNKDLHCVEDGLKAVGIRARKWDHVVTYIRYRKPDNATLEMIYTAASYDGNDNYTGLKKIYDFAKTRYSERTEALLKSILLTAIHEGNAELAIILVNYCHVAPSLESLTKNPSEIKWEFSSNYIYGIKLDKTASQFIQNYFTMALDNKQFKAASAGLRRYAELNEDIITKENLAIILPLVTYCYLQNKDESAAPTMTMAAPFFSHVRPAFDSKKAKINAVCRYIKYLTKTIQISLTENEKALLLSNDIQQIINPELSNPSKIERTNGFSNK